MAHDPSGLSKSVWTNRDFEAMGWHDAALHGIAFGASRADDPDAEFFFALDLDYIVRWVGGDPTFSFWLAPATLVFEHAWNLRVEGAIDQMNSAEVVDLHHVRRYSNAAGFEFDEWHVEGDAFDIWIEAASFMQYFRRAPVLTDRQRLSHEERGGISFQCEAYDSAS